MEPILKAQGLARTFGKHRAVEHVDLELVPGEVVGLLGPNGAGKTTTLRMLLGHLPPSSGRVELFGKRVTTGCPALARVGAMVEGPAFYPWLSGRRNLEVMLACRGFGRKERRRRAGEAGEMLGLGEALDRRYGGYSSGMERRLGVAAALAHDPEVVVLDEPTAGLDPLGTVELRDLLRSIARQGKAILLSSHLLGDVEVLADRIVLVSRGRVERAGRTADLLGGAADRVMIELAEMSDDALQRARVVAATVEGVRPIDGGASFEVEGDREARARLVTALVEAGLPPVGIERRRLTLEQFFLEETLAGRRADTGTPSEEERS